MGSPDTGVNGFGRDRRPLRASREAGPSFKGNNRGAWNGFGAEGPCGPAGRLALRSRGTIAALGKPLRCRGAPMEQTERRRRRLRNGSHFRRRPHTSVHVRRSQCSRSPESVFTFSAISKDGLAPLDVDNLISFDTATYSRRSLSSPRTLRHSAIPCQNLCRGTSEAD